MYINRPEEAHIGLFARTEGANISNVGLIDNEIEALWTLGGLVGGSYDTTIDNCYARGAVIGIQDMGSGVGGLVGYADDSSTINNSYATGTVIGHNYVGGLVGDSNGATISNSYATGSVTGNQSSGGLVGDSWGSILNCYATGSVTGTDNYVGGLVGLSNSLISNSYAAGYVSGSGSYTAGGLVGGSWSNSTTSNSFWDIETSGQTESDGGTGLTTSEMQTLSTYLTAGWDFLGETVNGTEDIWTFMANDYPHLSFEGYEDQPLTPPSNLQATVEIGSINLAWSDPLPGSITLIGYNAYRDEVQINTTIIDETHYEDTNITSGASYSYFVTALYDDDESEPSNTIEVTAFTPTITLPNPENLQIIIAGNDAQLSWDAVTADVNDNPITPDFYNVYRSDSSPDGGYELIGTTPENNYTFSDILTVIDIAFIKVTAVKETTSPNYEVFIYDNFESYELNTFPSAGGWNINYNGAGDSQQYITNQYSFEGEKSFRLQGKSNWDARIINELSSTPSVVYYEVSFYSESVAHEGKFSLYNPLVGDWGSEMFRCDFDNGAITFPGGDVEVDYIPEQWYSVKIKADVGSGRVSAWLDGVQLMDNVEYSVPSFSYTHFQITAINDGTNIVFFDNIKVWTE